MSAIDADEGLLREMEEVFDTEFEQVERSAYLLARRLGRSPDDALDAVQDAAEQAWRYRGTRHGPFRPWFLAIVFHAAARPRLRGLLLPERWRPEPPPDLVSERDPDLMAALGRSRCWTDRSPWRRSSATARGWT